MDDSLYRGILSLVNGPDSTGRGGFSRRRPAGLFPGGQGRAQHDGRIANSSSVGLARSHGPFETNLWYFSLVMRVRFGSFHGTAARFPGRWLRTGCREDSAGEELVQSAGCARASGQLGERPAGQQHLVIRMGVKANDRAHAPIYSILVTARRRSAPSPVCRRLDDPRQHQPSERLADLR
jgi:hypothetical protein